jgi:hypothetical protein
MKANLDSVASDEALEDWFSSGWRPAGFWLRMKASFIDTLALGLALSIPLSFVFGTNGAASAFGLSPTLLDSVPELAAAMERGADPLALASVLASAELAREAGRAAGTAGGLSPERALELLTGAAGEGGAFSGTVPESMVEPLRASLFSMLRNAVLSSDGAAFALGIFLTMVFWRYLRTTPGKAWYGMVVLDARTGEALSLWRGLVRHVGYLLCAIPFLLGFLSVAFDSRKRGWQDRLAGSIVLVHSSGRGARRPR